MGEITVEKCSNDEFDGETFEDLPGFKITASSTIYCTLIFSTKFLTAIRNFHYVNGFAGFETNRSSSPLIFVSLLVS